MWTAQQIDEACDSFMAQTLTALRSNGSIAPMALLLACRNPDTMEAMRLPVILVWEGPSFGDAASVSAWSVQLRALADSCQAIGLAHASEVMMVEDDSVPLDQVARHIKARPAVHVGLHFVPSVMRAPSGRLAIFDRTDATIASVDPWRDGPAQGADQVDFAKLLPAA